MAIPGREDTATGEFRNQRPPVDEETSNIHRESSTTRAFAQNEWRSAQAFLAGRSPIPGTDIRRNAAQKSRARYATDANVHRPPRLIRIPRSLSCRTRVDRPGSTASHTPMTHRRGSARAQASEFARCVDLDTGFLY